MSNNTSSVVSKVWSFCTPLGDVGYGDYLEQLTVSELESKLTVCDKIEETISQSLQQAETLRQSILKWAFEGRFVSITN